MKQTNTTASKMSDEEQLDTILNNVFGYLEVGESGIHGTDEEHRSALKRALLAWHQKELEKAKLEAREDATKTLALLLKSNGGELKILDSSISSLPRMWEVYRIEEPLSGSIVFKLNEFEELSKLQEEQK